MLEKLNLFGVMGQVTLVAIDVKMYGFALEKISSFKMLGLSLSPKLDCSPYNISITNTTSKKTVAFIRYMKFFHLRLHFICINLPYGFARNTVLISRLLLLAAIWVC